MHNYNMNVISGTQINITHAMFIVNILYSLYFKNPVNIIKLRQSMLFSNLYIYIINCNHPPQAVIVTDYLFKICIFCHYTDRGNTKPQMLFGI